MSFVEFLLEYYVYILVVLIILIVGVIGFLVDSKSKDKKTKNNDKASTNNGNATEASLDSGVNASQVTNENTNISSNNVVNQVEQSQGNALVDNVQNINNAVVQPKMESVGAIQGNSSDNLSLNSGIIGSQVAQNDNLNMTINPNSLESNNSNVMVSSSNVGNSMTELPNIQPEVSNIAVTQPQMNVVNNGMDSSLGMTPNVVGVQNIQPEVSNVAVTQPQMNVVDNMGNIPQNMTVMPNTQPVTTNIPVTQFQTGVNGLSNGMSIPQSVENTVIGAQNVQSQMGNNVIEPINPLVNDSAGVNTNMGGNVNLNNGISSAQVVQPQVAMGNNLQYSANTVAQNEISPNTNVQGTNSNSVQQNLNNGAVLTSNGSQPFDISSMFANNQ